MAKIKFNLVKLEKEIIFQILQEEKIENLFYRYGSMTGKFVEVNGKNFVFVYSGHSFPEIRVDSNVIINASGREQKMISGNIIFLSGNAKLPNKVCKVFNSNEDRDIFYSDLLEGFKLSSDNNIKYLPIRF